MYSKFKIVMIGGGTGLSSTLKGLKEFTESLTAIVTIADDGGSSGALRRDLGILAPGDIRNCLLALANAGPTLEKLFDYRFKIGSLENHSMGNLLIAAMTDIFGSFEKGIEEISNVLAITGKVLPMTLENVDLYGELENGMIIKGESKISEYSLKYNSPIKKISIGSGKYEPVKQAIDSIKKADLICLGPGSLYTSVIPNLLVEDMPEEIKKSKAKVVYIANVLTEEGETTGYTLTDHVDAIYRHLNYDIIDIVIGNTQVIDGVNNLVIPTSDEIKKLNERNIKFKAMTSLLIVEKSIIYDNKELAKKLIEISAGGD